MHIYSYKNLNISSGVFFNENPSFIKLFGKILRTHKNSTAEKFTKYSVLGKQVSFYCASVTTFYLYYEQYLKGSKLQLCIFFNTFSTLQI